jgi:hypothetical protein
MTAPDDNAMASLKWFQKKPGAPRYYVVPQRRAPCRRTLGTTVLQALHKHKKR